MSNYESEQDFKSEDSIDITDDQKPDLSLTKSNLLNLIKKETKISKSKICEIYEKKYNSKLSIPVDELCKEMGQVSIESGENGESFVVLAEKKKSEEKSKDGSQESEVEISEEIVSDEFSLSEGNYKSDGDNSVESCYYCKKTGHSPMDCKEKGGEDEKAAPDHFEKEDFGEGNEEDGNKARRFGGNNFGGVSGGGNFGGGNFGGGNFGGSNGGGNFGGASGGGSFGGVSGECWSFKKGSCRFGDRCRYSHDVTQENGAPANDRKENSNQRWQEDEHISEKPKERRRKKAVVSTSESYSSSFESESGGKRNKTKLKDQIKMLELKVHVKRLTAKLRRRDKEISRLKREVRHAR